MIIDFHTHIFPHKIAPRALSHLQGFIRTEPCTEGTMESLLASMKMAGVDISVVLPVVTDPHQFDSILRFAVQTNELFRDTAGPRLLSFAGIHPDSADYKEQLRLIVREGFKGIKLHPIYQGVCFDDIRCMRLIEEASSLGLIVLTHAGYDPMDALHDYCTPDMILHMMKEVAPRKLVLAHMGGNLNHAEVLKKLCGLPLYLDTAYSISHLSLAALSKLIRAHGVDRVLFASDSPWSDQADDVEHFQALPDFTDKEKNMICYENAAALLGLEV